MLVENLLAWRRCGNKCEGCILSTFGFDNLPILIIHPKAMGCNICRLGQIVVVWPSIKTQGYIDLHERTFQLLSKNIEEVLGSRKGWCTTKKLPCKAMECKCSLLENSKCQ